MIRTRAPTSFTDFAILGEEPRSLSIDEDEDEDGHALIGTKKFLYNAELLDEHLEKL